MCCCCSCLRCCVIINSNDNAGRQLLGLGSVSFYLAALSVRQCPVNGFPIVLFLSFQSVRESAFSALDCLLLLQPSILFQTIINIIGKAAAAAAADSVRRWWGRERESKLTKLIIFTTWNAVRAAAVQLVQRQALGKLSAALSTQTFALILILWLETLPFTIIDICLLHCQT